MEYLQLLGGLAILIIAGEFLVRGAVGIALKFKISPLVIGMTIVSFGTSAPELLVSIRAALAGHPELAIGNVLGSNIANIALVLGITTMIMPITIKRTTKALDWPVMMLATVLFYLFAFNNNLEWWEGVIYVAGLIIFNVYLFWKSIKDNRLKESENEDVEIEGVSNHQKITKSILLVVAGAIGLAYGAGWLTDGAITIAANYGVSDRVIGLTVVAFGTSVPELITSIMAAIKKETDISVGNLIGSNIFNLMAVLGITSIIKEIPINFNDISSDIYWVFGISFLLFPMMLKNKISRFSGFILFSSYCLYIYFVLS